MSTGRRVEKLESALPQADPEAKPALAHLHPVDYRAALYFSEDAARAVLDYYNIGGCPLHFFLLDEMPIDVDGEVVVHSTLGTGHEPKWMERDTLIRHPVRPAPIALRMELSVVDDWRRAWILHNVEMTKLKPPTRELDEEAFAAIDDVAQWLPEQITAELFEWYVDLPLPPDLDAAEDVDSYPADLPPPPGAGWREVLEEVKTLKWRASDWRNRSTVDRHALSSSEASRLISGIEACAAVVAEAAAVEAVQGLQ